ncbi:MAG: sterol desaturase family protein [Cyclobacteriaceae bacterium]|nr:sterol desaturase family protein [Cyclobacteriaceae bacterium]
MPSAYLTGTKTFWSILLVIFLRYLLLASVAFFLYYVLKKKTWRFKKIQRSFPLQRDYFREFGYSVMTTFVFAGVGYVMFLSPVVQYTKVYFKLGEYGVAYFVASILLIIVLHDTYFYWMHRLMHHKVVFRMAHRVHHLSTNPSPWAAMAFHPVEAVIEAGILVIVPFLFPIHPLAIGIFLLFMMIYNVYGHLGYELYPKGFSKNLIGRWVNTSVNHNMHHQFFSGNYGLYFLFWDRIMGTIHPTYDQQFDDVKSR